MCSGVLLLVDAGLTLAWQEPVSAFMAGREQSQLRGQLNGLNKLAQSDKQAVGDDRDVRRRLAKLAALQARRDKRGRAVGRLKLPSLHRSYVVVEGTDTDSLRKGPGHYANTPLPGQGATVGVAGHRTTYGAPFRTIDKLKRGDELVMDMPYGRFTYVVDKTQIVNPDATWITHKRRHEMLVLSACHPLYSAAKRIVAFATLRSSVPK
jgi:sortase A